MYLLGVGTRQYGHTGDFQIQVLASMLFAVVAVLYLL